MDVYILDYGFIILREVHIEFNVWNSTALSLNITNDLT